MAAGLWEERGKSPGLPQSFPTFRACFEYILQTLYAFFLSLFFFGRIGLGAKEGVTRISGSSYRRDPGPRASFTV